MFDPVTSVASYALFNELKSGIVMIDNRGLVTYYNKRAESLINQHYFLQIGKHIQDIIPDSQLLRVVHTKKMEEGNLFLLSDNQSVRISRYPLIDKDNSVSGAIAVLTDSKEKPNWTSADTIRTVIDLIMQNTADGYALYDEQGKLIMQNSSYKEILITLTDINQVKRMKTCREKVYKTRRPIVEQFETSSIYIHMKTLPIMVEGKLRGCLQSIVEETEKQQLRKEQSLSKRIIRALEQSYQWDDFIYRSPLMSFAIEQGRIAASTNRVLFIRGEEGTGKFMLANAIHNNSDRSLFAFKRIHPKRNEEDWRDFLLSDKFQAFKGTILIEEINHLLMEEQEQLLKKLTKRSTDPQFQLIISATEKLEKLLIAGSFSESLYDELMKFHINLPSLQERKEDIIPLCEHALEQLTREYGCTSLTLDTEVQQILIDYPYQENIKELKALLSLASLKAKKSNYEIKKEYIAFSTTHSKQEQNKNSSLPREEVEDKRLSVLVEEYEKVIIEKTLRELDGNKTLTAKELGLSVRNLYYKLDKYHLS
ncbi:sigma 54-interacting transcriptional regulator [Bacillus sp. B1-b2]|uniref:sigma 54-interacting transcriptional regulator n=1 Tax=Bacillus sp. B1-b2 TaxID=2653201 RepID=UPI0012619584|nr:sigma 54-interacting transcriptional regulator [Bacillus sp. B1-b2]KAB7669962.1 hypothetical protein F9279_09470 [Bacillus sp. B1-b2]